MSSNIDDQYIITHFDLDGVVSAAFLLHAFEYDGVKFAGPKSIEDSKMIITDNDTVCDLPYPLTCFMWFDHHPGNLEMVKQRGINIDDIEGRFAAKDSCAEVVRDYLVEEEGITIPKWWDKSLININQIDAFKYNSVEEWLQVNPERIISDALKATLSNQREHEDLLQLVTYESVDNPPGEVAKIHEVRSAYDIFKADEKQQFQFIMENAKFHSEDSGNNWILLDLTYMKKPPRINRQIAFMVYHSAKGVIVLTRAQKNSLPTTNINVSISHGFFDSEKLPDFGEELRQMNIGSGHRGAAAGTIYCPTQREMQKAKDDFIAKVIADWNSYLANNK